MNAQPSTSDSSRLALPHGIRRVLRRVARKDFLVRVAWFPLLVAAILPLLWLAQGLVDFVLTLSWGVRLVLLLGNAVLVGWLFFRHVLVPMRNRLTLRTSALLVERRFPAFRTSLISAVDFSGYGAGPAGTSQDLARRLIGRVERQVGQTDILRGIAVPRRQWQLLGGAVASCALVAFLAWQFQPHSMVLAKRILLSDQALPKRTSVEAITGDLLLNTGSDAELSARATGLVPKSGQLVVVHGDGREEIVTAEADPAEPEVFRVTLRNVLAPFRYRFELNDGVGEEFEVTTRTLPSLTRTRFTQHYPGYTKQPPAELSAGSLTLLAGGRLVIEAESTQPLKSATLELKGLDKTLRMDSGDPVANLRHAIRTSEAQAAEINGQVEKLRPLSQQAEAEEKAAAKVREDAKKLMDAAPDGDEKRQLGWEFEQKGNAYNKARDKMHRTRSEFQKAERELKAAREQARKQKEQLDKLLADYKEPDVETAARQKSQYRAEIDIPNEGLSGLSIHLLNEEGLASENDPVYRVNLIRDKPPVVRLTEPRSTEKTVLPADTVRLKFTARDDFGIERLLLKYVVLRPNQDGYPTPTAQGEIPMAYTKGDTNVAVTYSWPLATILPPLTAGCVVNYWVEAADYYTLYSPGAGTSRKMNLMVVTPEEKKEELLEEMEKAARQIESLSERQGKANEKTSDPIRR